MITAQELRKTARERKLALDLVEKDYALGWVIIGISSSKLGEKLIFKGGTALSKVHFPSRWRLSEDLDFTLAEGAELEDVNGALATLPSIVRDISGGLSLSFRDKPFTNPGFLRVRAQYDGPITRNTIKLEVSKETYIGDTERVTVPKTYDYPEYSIHAYTINNILAEKLRAIIERGAVRDYYDAWKLLKTGRVDEDRARELFLRKCEGKGVAFVDPEQFFPEGIAEVLEPYLESSLARLSPEPLPPITHILDELKTNTYRMFNRR